MNRYKKLSIEELEAIERDLREFLSSEQLHTDADRLDRAAAVTSIRRVAEAIDDLRHPMKSMTVRALY